MQGRGQFKDRMGRAYVEDNEEKMEDLAGGDQGGEGHENILHLQPNAWRDDKGLEE